MLPTDPELAAIAKCAVGMGKDELRAGIRKSAKQTLGAMQ
jgi:hypothetical protein